MCNFASPGVDALVINFRRFSPIFGEKMAFIYKTLLRLSIKHCYDQTFAKNKQKFAQKNAKIF
jgi:hypothetical protein